MASDAVRHPPIDRALMVKRVDAWWTVLLVDPIATRLVPVLARRPKVTPTRVTWFAHALGLVAIALYSLDLGVAAAIVFEARFVADCIDGKLARVLGSSSTFGRLLDTFGDRVLTVGCIVALGWRHSPEAVALITSSYALSFHLLDERNELLGQVESPDTPTTPAAGWRGALAQRRLYPIPTSVDVEHVLLVVVPLATVLGADVTVAALWGAAAYFALQIVRYGAAALRAAADLDRVGTGL